MPTQDWQTSYGLCQHCMRNQSLWGAATMAARAWNRDCSSRCGFLTKRGVGVVGDEIRSQCSVRFSPSLRNASDRDRPVRRSRSSCRCRISCRSCRPGYHGRPRRLRRRRRPCRLLFLTCAKYATVPETAQAGTGQCRAARRAATTHEPDETTCTEK